MSSQPFSPLNIGFIAHDFTVMVQLHYSNQPQFQMQHAAV